MLLNCTRGYNWLPCPRVNLASEDLSFDWSFRLTYYYWPICFNFCLPDETQRHFKNFQKPWPKNPVNVDTKLHITQNIVNIFYIEKKLLPKKYSKNCETDSFHFTSLFFCQNLSKISDPLCKIILCATFVFINKWIKYINFILAINPKKEYLGIYEWWKLSFQKIFKYF